VLEAITEAVSSGVGLYNEGWVATSVPGINHPKVRRLYLADQVGRYHTPGSHHLPVSATVLKRHPVIKSLRPGDKFEVTGCGRVFTPRPDAGTVLAEKDQPVVSLPISAPVMGPMKMPAITVGHLGKGRVVVAAFGTCGFVEKSGMLWNFISDALDWLAEPALADREKRWDSEHRLSVCTPS
jgi:hypothetical protein